MTRAVLLLGESEGYKREPCPRPPLVGPPPPPVKDRPACPGCGRRLRPYLRSIHEQEPDGTWQVGAKSRQWTGGYHGFGEFCGTFCAAKFANRVVRILFPALPASVPPKLVRPPDGGKR